MSSLTPLGGSCSRCCRLLPRFFLTHEERQMDNKKENFYIRQIRGYLDNLGEELKEAELRSQKACFDFSGKKVMALEAYKMPSVSFDAKCPDAAQKKADELYEQDKATRERNQAVAENNKEIKEALIVLMQNLGFAETVRKRKSARSYKTVEEKTAWRDFVDLIPTDAWGTQLDRIYKEWCERIERRRAEITAEEVKRTRQAEAEEKKRNEMKVLVTLGMKYGQEFHSVDDTIQKIILKDKYLYLAYYLERNRGDWSDGCGYAQTGLEHFNIETPADKEIVKEISDICAEFEDGRSFRDCTWNYSVLYGMADKNLLADLETLKEYESIW